MRCSVHGSMPCSKRRSFSNDVSEVRFRPHVSCHTYTYTAVPVSGRKCGLLTSETSCKSVSCHTADRSLAPSAICSAFCTHRAPRACETETVRAEPTGTAHATRRQAQGDFLTSVLTAQTHSGSRSSLKSLKRSRVCGVRPSTRVPRARMPRPLRSYGFSGSD